MVQQERGRAYIALACVCFFWGITYLAMRIGVQTFPALLLAGFRHSIGGIALCSFALARGYRLPSWKEMPAIIVPGLLMPALSNGLVTYAEKYVPSGLTALICSAIPFWIIGITAVSGRRDELNRGAFLGVAVGLVGQLIIFADSLKDLTDHRYFWGMLMIVFANISWATGTVYVRHRQTAVPPLLAAGLQMLVAGLVLNTIGFATGAGAHLNLNPKGILALLYLVLFGSIIAYGAYTYALTKLPAAIVSMYAYINPIVAVIFGWIVLDEKLTPAMGLAILITLGGVFLVNKGFRGKREKDLSSIAPLPGE